MKLSDIKHDTRRVMLTAKVVEKREPREVNTRYGATMVCEAVIEDETGTMILVLWGDEVEKVSEGDTVKIENGYVREWNGSLQLNVGKFGKLNVV